MELWEQLQLFGFTQYEAKAYVSLVARGTANAYQLSKESGIPRARIYDVVDGLAQRGLVMTEEGEDGTKSYVPLPVEAFVDQLKKRWKNTIGEVEKELKAIENQEPQSAAYVTTLKGEENIFAFCRILIRRARERVLLSMWSPMYDELLPELQAASKHAHLRGILFHVANPLPGLELHRMNHYMASLTEQRWFVLSIDGKELLYGHSAERNGNAFYTDDPVHIYLLEDYIWHDVLVNRLVAQGGQEQLDKWILPEMEKFFLPFSPQKPLKD